MARKSNEQIRAELDELNQTMKKKQHVSDLQLIAALATANRPDVRQKFNNSNKGKKTSDEVKLKISEKNKGRTAHNKGKPCPESVKEFLRNKKASDETKEKMRLSKIGIARPQLTCPHCGTSGGDAPMKRWHFDNCKHK